MAGLVLGAAFGAVVRRSHFCTMGAVSDLVLFGSRRRLRVWALAIATALGGTQALVLAGLVPIDGSPYLAPRLFWLGAVLGGLLSATAWCWRAAAPVAPWCGSAAAA